MGGGGSSGAVSWPDTHMIRHAQMYDQMFDQIVTREPSDSATIKDFGAYDPATEVTSVREYVNDHETYLDNLDIASLWDGYVGSAIDNYGSAWGSGFEFLTPDPRAMSDIASMWESPDPNASSDITTMWESPEPDAPRDIKDNLAYDAYIDDAVNKYRNVVNDQLANDVLPRFEAGMQDINAVMSSAFVIGRSVIEGMGQRDVSKFQSDLRFKAFLQRDQLLGQAYMQDDQISAADVDGENKAVAQAYLQEDQVLAADIDGKNKTTAQAYLQDDQILAEDAKTKNLINADIAKNRVGLILQVADKRLRATFMKADSYSSLAQMGIESNRIAYVMQKEELDKANDWRYAGINNWQPYYTVWSNIFASISGGTGFSSPQQPTSSVLGGAFAGASLGAKVADNTPIGAGIGAVLGGVGAALLS